MERRYDLVVLRGGTAGLIASLYAARAGARVVLVEQAEQPGGDRLLGPARAAEQWWSQHYLTPRGRRLLQPLLATLRAVDRPRRPMTRLLASSSTACWPTAPSPTRMRASWPARRGDGGLGCCATRRRDARPRAERLLSRERLLARSTSPIVRREFHQTQQAVLAGLMGAIETRPAQRLDPPHP
jgi:glycine/D-amino acid oxidase-like deaminating enzyme